MIHPLKSDYVVIENYSCSSYKEVYEYLFSFNIFTCRMFIEIITI